MQKNKLLIKAIKDAFTDEKQTAEYKLQLDGVGNKKRTNFSLFFKFD